MPTIRPCFEASCGRPAIYASTGCFDHVTIGEQRFAAEQAENININMRNLNNQYMSILDLLRRSFGDAFVSELLICGEIRHV